MALTSSDETDLLLPLYRGLHEQPRFSTFLERLRRRTGARIARIIVEPAYLSAHIPLRPFRAYALAEIEGDLDTDHQMRQLLAEDEISDARLARFPLSEGTQGWLVVAGDEARTAADSALVSSLVPYLQTVLETGQEIDRDCARSELSSRVMAKAGAGWILFDREARILAIEEKTREALENQTGHVPQIGERLRGIDPSARNILADAAQCHAEGGDGATRQAVLLAEPSLEVVLKPIDADSPTVARFPAAAIIAWCRFSPDETEARAVVLAGLYDLPAREAQLAVALADGLSIAEAALAMGLTLETARNYSKRLYAKLDVGGQAQLVRLVYRSSAILA